MRVLVTGAGGQVGRELLLAAPTDFHVLGLTSKDLDVSNSQAVCEFFSKWKPELIINAAAYTAVDKAEGESDKAYSVNDVGVANLATSAASLGIPLFHISTDYVFSGIETSPYNEQNATKPTGVYGASKLAGERRLVNICPQHIILRTSWIFGVYGNNFVKTMLKLGREYEEIAVVADQYGGPTSAHRIASVLWMLAKKYWEEKSLSWGIYHFSGLPICTWQEFAETIFSKAYEQGLLSRTPRVAKISTAQYNAAAPRPAWSVLDCGLIYERFAIPQPDWRIDLSALLSSLSRDHVNI